MKKKSTSQSAFLNLRVLFGLFVMLVGVFLALFATANPSGLDPNGLPQNQGGTTREELAALYQAMAPASFVPPACVPGAEIFADVPASNPFCPWIEEMSRRGITGGCAPGLFCPTGLVSRQQMAVFIVKVVASEPFHIVGGTGEPAFQNGWNNFGFGYSLAGFFKDPMGIVHLKGTLSGGGSGSIAFTLPEGYRPAENLFLPIAGGGPIAANLQIFPDGTVEPAGDGGGTPIVGLDGLTFRAAP
jgi:hypothetical protein